MSRWIPDDIGLAISSTNSERKRPTNVSLSGALLDEARALDINISQACERGLAMKIAEDRARRWLEENQEAIQSSNAYIERHGLPLARFRRF